MRHFSAQIVFPSTATVGRPVAAEVVNLASAREVRNFRQCVRKYGLVARPIMGRTEGAADWMIDKGSARRRDFTHDIVSGADH